ncbi:hypothetical protein CIHG_03545 [Coccidioides immitis H538.4]|uniref:Uncharacterized protein n=3 Tax=Coccidioides immitis TaxID=5501 RepID=A0A0J8TPR7_COCIT|nr:hypothetical protein CIRG_08893 [Coccidioides immitis RMSCC 2394]KMU75707.1 hypothetical protein CISG_04881 [Coccidioides immitis RMSCC 3703]KMU86015.1 hypothetical protein CIHG_03545 [Coccidioides immitis H538.4]
MPNHTFSSFRAYRRYSQSRKLATRAASRSLVKYYELPLEAKEKCNKSAGKPLKADIVAILRTRRYESTESSDLGNNRRAFSGNNSSAVLNEAKIKMIKHRIRIQATTYVRGELKTSCSNVA